MQWINFIVEMATLGAIYSIVAVAFNIQYGYTKMVNFGIVAWFAIGAYAYAITTGPTPKPEDAYMFAFGFPPLIGLLGAGFASGIIAYLLGLPTLKLTGHYFAIVTFAFAEIVGYVLTNEKWLTNGTVGFFGIRRPLVESVGPNLYHYLFFITVMIALIVTYMFFMKICNAPFGKVLKAIREDEIVCLALGKEVLSFKMRAFVSTSIVMGIAGGLYAMHMTLVTPEMFNLLMTFTILFAVVIGGKANNKGAILVPCLRNLFLDIGNLRYLEVSTE